MNRKLVTLHLPLDMRLAVDVFDVVAKHYPEAVLHDVFTSLATPDGTDVTIWMPAERVV